jgi:glycosyltransferase involved in cell wall biosynthesis
MMRRLWRAAYAVAKIERPEIVHCRSYLPLELGARLKKRLGTRFLADFRDFWADVGFETKRFKFVYRYYLAREPRLLGPADHIVTLTERAARMLMSRYPQVGGGRRSSYTVIPCCADFALFDPSRMSSAAVQARREQLGIDAAACVLLYLGSLGPDYLLPRMMDLFVELRKLWPDAIFLVLANNGRELVEQVAHERRIPPEAIRFTSAAREEVPEYMALANMAVVFIRPAQSKAGCSPTKLGELLAANVPVIANRNVGDMDLILSPEKNASIVVPDFEPATLRRALQDILAVSAEDRSRIRGMSGEFDLDEGVRRYDTIYRSLVRHEGIPQADVMPPRRQLAAIG